MKVSTYRMESKEGTKAHKFFPNLRNVGHLFTRFVVRKDSNRFYDRGGSKRGSKVLSCREDSNKP